MDIRTTVGLPGSGLSVINRKSWWSIGDKTKSGEIQSETQFPRISEGGREPGNGDKVFEGDDVPDGSSEHMELDIESWAIRSYLRPCFKVLITSFGGIVFWAAVGGFLLVHFVILHSGK
jgi:hypothetical protein